MNPDPSGAPPVHVAVLTGYGLNCDHETAHAFDLVGGLPHRVHINDLIGGHYRLDDYDILVLDGGFSWADDHGAGVLEAARLKHNLAQGLQAFIDAGKLILGICNGFQALVNLGFLPGFEGNYGKKQVALTWNDCGNFRDDWVHLAVNPETACVFTQGMKTLELSIRHGEGKFIASDEVIDRLHRQGQIVLRYATAKGVAAEGVFPDNPNGSLDDIAGICDPSGRIFGLMPHPEAFNHWTNHPDWTALKVRAKRQGQVWPPGPTPAMKLFENAVTYMQGSR